MTVSEYTDLDYLADFPPIQFPKNNFVKGKDLTPDGVASIGKTWVDKFNKACDSKDPKEFDNLVAEGGLWRDVIAFTNDYRTFVRSKILSAATDRLALVKPENAVYKEAVVSTPSENYSTFIICEFSFSTYQGPCAGMAHLIKTDDGDIKAFVLFTALDGIHGHVESIDHNRPLNSNNGWKSYDEMRKQELKDPKPDVIIVGAGHGGLSVAAHLKAFGLKPLIVDREKRVGDNWRHRYSSLSLHNPCYESDMAYMPFPRTWPAYPSSGKLANWIEHYADTLELDVWTESELIPSKSSFDEKSQQWNVTVKGNATGKEYKFTVSHVVMATGFGGGKAWYPEKAPGQDTFKGKITHSSQVPGGGPFKGEKVLIVGTGSSGHDLALDCFRNGAADVVMLQRSPTYIMSIKHGMGNFVEPTYNQNTRDRVPFLDKTSESTPRAILKYYLQEIAHKVAELDKDLLDGIHKAGFKTFLGPQNTGFPILAVQRGGGYYYNSENGGSTQIAKGNIKVQPGEIKKFTENSVEFTDGTTMDADSVVFCTGYTGYRDSVAEILGDEYAGNLKPIWGLDEEQELQGVFRDCGVPNFYMMVGALNVSRFNSKIIALQIIAQKEGKFGKRYTIDAQKASNGA